MYDLTRLNRALASTVYSGKLHFVSVTGSTNSDARQAALLGAPDGSVYLADEQTAGRGRSNHGWESAAGEGLYVSVLLRPKWDAARLQWLPLAAGLAAAEAIETLTGLTVDLRWPNDLMIGSCKVGGILVEAKLTSDPQRSSVDSVVVGVGINVHQRNFRDEIGATSLDREAEEEAWRVSAPSNRNAGAIRINRQELLLAMLNRLQIESALLGAAEGQEGLRKRMEKSSTWLVGRSVKVHGPQACNGITMGLDEQGMLLVQTESGLISVCTGGIRDAAR